MCNEQNGIFTKRENDYMCKYSKYTKAAMISLWQSGYSFCEIRKKLPLFGYSDDDVKNAMIKALEEKRERIDEEIKRINEEGK